MARPVNANANRFRMALNLLKRGVVIERKQRRANDWPASNHSGRPALTWFPRRVGGSYIESRRAA